MSNYANGLKLGFFLRCICRACVGVCLLQVGCSVPHVSSDKSQTRSGAGQAKDSTSSSFLLAEQTIAKDLLTINSVAVMPLVIGADAMAMAGERESFESEVEQALRRNLGVEVLPVTTVFPAKSGLDVEVAKSTSISNQLRARANSKGADALFRTTLYRFLNRDGSTMGANDPAEVFFASELFRTSDGSRIWSATYAFKDKAVMDNLLDIGKNRQSGSGLGWRSAREVFNRGIDEAARDLGSKRESAFRGEAVL